MFSTVFCTTPVIAQSQTYYFAGKLNDPFGTLPSGTPFCGSFSYDKSQADNTPLIPYRGDYHYTNVSVTVDGVTVTDNGTGAMHVFDHGAGYPTDLFYIYTFESSGALGGLTLAPSGLQLALQDITGAVFNGPSILGPDLSLSNFTTGNATFLQLQAESVIPPSPFPQSVTARGELTALSASPFQCAHTVIPLAGTGGSISPATPQSVSHGSTVTFTVTPNTGYIINKVNGCGGSLNGSIYTTGAIMENCTVTASFKLNDSDGDGVVDDAEQCPNTAPGTVVDGTGCSISQLVPCEGPKGTTEAWTNKGQYVSSVTKSAESFLAAGLITPAEKDVIVSAAATSGCGGKK